MTVQIFQKMPFNFISLDLQTFNSEPPPFRFPPSKSQSKTAVVHEYSTEKSLFFSCISILIVRKFQTEHLILNFSRYSNSYFTGTTGFISSIRVGIEKIQNVERLPIGEMSLCIPCISVLTGQIFQEVVLFLNSLQFETYIPQPLQVRIPPSRTQSKTKHL